MNAVNILKNECACEMRLEHSVVVDSRFRWVKREQCYQKYRRRKCTVCKKRFSTLEIDKKDI